MELLSLHFVSATFAFNPILIPSGESEIMVVGNKGTWISKCEVLEYTNFNCALRGEGLTFDISLKDKAVPK